MITLLVSEISNDHHITPTDLIDDDPSSRHGSRGWYKHNNDLLNTYSSHKLFNVIRLAEYDQHPNPYYVINMRVWEDFLDPNIWNVIPEDQEAILAKYKIPILLWHPLEGSDDATFDDWRKIETAKKSTKLRDNKIIVLCVAPLRERNLTKKYTQSESKLENIDFVFSINYNIKYGNFNISNQPISFYEEKKPILCSIEDHDPNKKKCDFLCLNNRVETRLNRILLLQSLYLEKKLYNNNLISARWYLHNTNSFVLNNNKKRSILFFDQLQGLLIHHDKKITNDKSFLRIIEILENILDGEEYISDDNIYTLKKELSCLNKENFSKAANFLSTLILNSIDKGIFSKRKLDKEHPKVLEEDENNFMLTRKKEQLPKSILLSGSSVSLSPENISSMQNGYINDHWHPDWYKESWFSIITESWTYHESQIENDMCSYHPIISEKTAKAILNHHPFIIFGPPGCNEVLEMQGFKRFDQSLLGLPEKFSNGQLSAIEMLSVLIDALKQFSNKNHKEKEKLWNHIKNDVVHNFDVLMNTDWIKVQHDLILNKEKN